MNQMPRGHIRVPVKLRSLLAFEHLMLVQERKQAAGMTGVTDSDVLDIIDAWSTRACEEGCRARGNCCDYARLSWYVWGMVEAQKE